MTPKTQWRRRAERRLDGLCAWCGKPSGKRALCPDHSAKHRAYETARQKRVMAEGRCVRCGNQRGLEGTASHCRPCANRLSEKAATRQAFKRRMKP